MNPVCPTRAQQRRYPCIPSSAAILSFAERRIRFLPFNRVDRNFEHVAGGGAAGAHEPEAEFPDFPEASQ